MTVLPAELAAQIRDAPDDRETYLVAADWLQQRGDPHGELIALAIGSPRDPRLAELAARIAPIANGYRLAFDWRWGFVRRIAVRYGNHDAVHALRTLLDAPCALVPTELALIEDAPDGADMLELISSRSAQLATLRSLVLYPAELDNDVLASILAAAPALERLVLDAGDGIELSPISTLRELRLRGIDSVSLAAPWPALESLVIDVDETADRLLAMLRRGRFPRLRRLAVWLHDGVDEQAWRDLAAELGLARLLITSLMGHQLLVDDEPGESPGLLVMADGRGRAGTLYTLPDVPQLVLGSDQSADVLFDNAAPASPLARLDNAGGEWTITSLPTITHTRVDGIPASWTPLRSGAEIELYTTVLRYIDSAADLATLRARYRLPR